MRRSVLIVHVTEFRILRDGLWMRLSGVLTEVEDISAVVELFPGEGLQTVKLALASAP